MKTIYDGITLLIDMDDTIENLLESWVHTLNATHGTSVNPEDITEWDMMKFFPALTAQEVYAPLFCDDFWKTVKPKPMAPAYIKRLIDDGFSVYICTNSNYHTIKAKYENIILAYFPFINWNQMILASNKSLICGDILVDDGVHNLIDGKYEKILMSAPHNKSFDATSSGMVRVNDWHEAYSAIIESANRLRGINGNKNILTWVS